MKTCRRFTRKILWGVKDVGHNSSHLLTRVHLVPTHRGKSLCRSLQRFRLFLAGRRYLLQDYSRIVFMREGYWVKVHFSDNRFRWKRLAIYLCLSMTTLATQGLISPFSTLSTSSLIILAWWNPFFCRAAKLDDAHCSCAGASGRLSDSDQGKT